MRTCKKCIHFKICRKLGDSDNMPLSSKFDLIPCKDYREDVAEGYLHSIKLLEKYVQTAKFEAIKEFWSRLQEEQEYLIGMDDKFKPYVSVEDGNNLVKEMVGDE